MCDFQGRPFMLAATTADQVAEEESEANKLPPQGTPDSVPFLRGMNPQQCLGFASAFQFFI